MFWVTNGWMLTLLVASLVVPALAGVDIVRRPVPVPTAAVVMLAALGAPGLAALWFLDWGAIPPDRWQAAGNAVPVVWLVLVTTSLVCGFGAIVLTASRAVRPGGPTRWSWMRLGFAAVAALAAPVIGDGTTPQ